MRFVADLVTVLGLASMISAIVLYILVRKE